MPASDLDFRNILIIDFGQMGDVIMSIPVLRAVRVRFSQSKITLLIGKPGRDIVRAADVSDEQIVVDRVKLRDSNKLWSIRELYRLVRDVRSRKFDLVIDLNSLYETNIIGYLSGAKHRLYSVRKGRSLDRLANFPTKPVPEDRSKHLTERYFDVVAPLGIEGGTGEFTVAISDDRREEANQLFARLGVNEKRRIGLFIGAGHPSRCWSLERFAELAVRLLGDPRNAVLVFLGPEEEHLAATVVDIFPDQVHVIRELGLLTFMAATSMLDAFVTNDTGPMHIAAITGTPIVLLIDKRAPADFLPKSSKVRVLNAHLLNELDVDEVYAAVAALIDGAQS